MKNIKIQRKILGLWALMRFMPVLTFSGSIVLINISYAWQKAGPAILKPALILAAGALTMNSFLAHSLNDMEDWRSGTDRVSRGILSGGSKVIKYGLLNRLELGEIAMAAFIFSLGIGTYFYHIRGPLVLVALTFGIFAAWVYTCPPLRLAYRPFLGEWICLWLSGTVLSTASYFILTGGFDIFPFFAGVVQSTLVLGWLMQHHVPDISADLSAAPVKLTTPAYFYLRWGPRYAMMPSAMYFVLALVLSIAGYYYIHQVFLGMAVVAILGILAAASTKSQDVMDVTRKQLLTTVLIIINSMVFMIYITL
ncbi:prenyltransferase [Thermoanaerobacteraceae bacterium SP2]|nr:prenyltransferase [Thermoanaerobacteraceae bacterium SP2]